MAFTRKKARAGANTETPPTNQPGTIIREVCTPSRTVFTQEHNELFIQQVFQYSQVAEGDEFYYHVLGLNDSSIEDDMKRAYRTLDFRFHPDKNNNSPFIDVMQMINEAKEEPERTFCHNYATKEQERVRMAQNTILI